MLHSPSIRFCTCKIWTDFWVIFAFLYLEPGAPFRAWLRHHDRWWRRTNGPWWCHCNAQNIWLGIHFQTRVRWAKQKRILKSYSRQTQKRHFFWWFFTKKPVLQYLIFFQEQQRFNYVLGSLLRILYTFTILFVND